MNATVWSDIAAAISGASGAPFAIESRTTIGGGYARQAETLVDRLLAET